MTVGALIVDTFRESFARKIFLGFWICSTLVLLLMTTVLSVDIVEGSLAAVKIVGEDMGGDPKDVERVVDLVLGGIAAFLFSVGLFLAIFSAAGLLPTVFEPGRIELLASKPVSRTTLLLGKYLGALSVVTLNILYLVCGAWLILGLKTGIWKTAFLGSAGLAIYAFAVMLTVVALVSVVSSSAVLSTMIAYVVMLIGTIAAQHAEIAPYFSSETPRQLLRLTYWALPKVFELGAYSRALMDGRPIESWDPFWTSAVFGVAALTAAARLLERKDF